MNDSDNLTKNAQFNEFFSIDHSFDLNVSLIDVDNVPSFEAFMNNIPLPFKIASDIIQLDQSAFRPLQALSGIASQLVEYLHHQTQKIDLLIGYIISQQHDDSQSYCGLKFGGGGLIFSGQASFQLGDMLELKLFLENNSCAIYCLGEVIAISENINQFHHKVVFHYIREEDREILVRSSLHEQSKQLQRLAQQRNEEH